MEIEIKYKDWDLKDIGSFKANSQVFDAQLREDLVAQVVRWQLAKARSGTRATKDRAMVSGTNRKPWAQKETGRSRQGSLRAPHFRKGGVCHGPMPQDFSFKLNKQIKRLASCSAISDKLRSQHLVVFENYEAPFKKTKEFIVWKNNNSFTSILFVIGDDVENLPLNRAFFNVPKCDIIPVRGFNVYDCLRHDFVVFDVNSLLQLQDRYLNTAYQSLEEGELNG